MLAGSVALFKQQKQADWSFREVVWRIFIGPCPGARIQLHFDFHSLQQTLLFVKALIFSWVGNTFLKKNWRLESMQENGVCKTFSTVRFLQRDDWRVSKYGKSFFFFFGLLIKDLIALLRSPGFLVSSFRRIVRQPHAERSSSRPFRLDPSVFTHNSSSTLCTPTNSSKVAGFILPRRYHSMTYNLYRLSPKRVTFCPQRVSISIAFTSKSFTPLIWQSKWSWGVTFEHDLHSITFPSPPTYHGLSTYPWIITLYAFRAFPPKIQLDFKKMLLLQSDLKCIIVTIFGYF